MSALPISFPADGTAAPTLRLVTVDQPSGTRTGRRRSPDASVAPRRARAPISVAQAWRRRAAASIVAGVAVAALVGVGSVAGGGADAGGGPLSTVPVAAETVVVQPGTTVWDVAVAQAPPGVTVPAYVRMILDENGLTSPDVDAWQVLRLPTG